MSERATWIGVSPCGHATFISADPEYVFPGSTPWTRPDKNRRSYDADEDVEWLEEKLGQYKDLVEQVRYYARDGRRLKLVTDEAERKQWCDSMRACIDEKCNQEKKS